MAAHLQQQLNMYESHPQWQGGWTCAATQESGEFAKFTIASVQAATPASALPTANQLTLLRGRTLATTTPSYDASTGIVTADSSNTLSTCRSKHPLSLNDGHFTVEITDNLSQVVVGLHSEALFLHRDAATIIRTAYAVSVTDKSTGSHIALATVQRPDSGPDVSKQIPYGSVISMTATDNHITFTVKNDIVSVYLGTAANLTKTLISDSMLPVCARTYALYPYIQMKASSTATFVQYTPLPTFNIAATYLQMGDASARENNRTSILAASSNFVNGEQSLRKGITASSPGVATLLISSTALFVNPHEPLAPDANMAEELGFNDAYVTPNTAAGGTETFLSNSVPDRSSSDEIMYVRLTGLTFESQNGATGGPSRILQPLARFTDNKTFGRMHFVPPQRTYMKLHNPSKLTVQEMQVDIVNSEEQVVADLLDYTFITLHIK
jgi:hypothetical protein